ncbi:MAG: PEPxxWA-CTERM sorting domain-containing protein [Pseudomonadota bacterium]
MHNQENSTGVEGRAARVRGWRSGLRLVACAAAALAIAAPAAAATVFGFTRDTSGATRVSEYDLSTGNLVFGASRLLDQNLSGDAAPIPFGQFGGGTFDPAGGYWAALAGQAGETIVGQFDTDTGNLVPGQAFRLDQNLSGNAAPIPLSDYGGGAFAPDGGYWAALAGQAGETIIGRFDTGTGNLVPGAAVRLDQNGAGSSAPIPLGDFAGFAFDATGNLWAALRGQAGETLISQFDTTTGNLVLGKAFRLDQNFSGGAAPIPLSDFGGFGFDPDGGFWAALRGQAGETILGQFDMQTGNLLPGASRRLDYNPSGDGAPVPFADFAGFAFAPSVATPGAVPEPGAWALMILGFGLAGATLRSRTGRRAAA